MHRDIKPSNILVNSRGNIKLCDFGVSSELVNSVADTFVGTGTYMAPERIQGSAYTVKSDVWSVGLTLMELAIGKFPFAPDYDANGDRMDEGPQGILDLLQQIVMEPPPKLPKSDAFPQILEDMITRCLMKAPEQRPTPQELYVSRFGVDQVTFTNLQQEYDAFVQAAKRTPVDLQAWAVGLMEKGNRKSQIAPQLSPATQDFLTTQRASPATSPPVCSPGYGEIPIGNLTLNSDGTGIQRIFPARISSVTRGPPANDYAPMEVPMFPPNQTRVAPPQAPPAPPPVPAKSNSRYPPNTRGQHYNPNQYGSFNDRTYF